jgi:hypothetical protein
MDNAEHSRGLNAVERFVAAIARVPKSEVDALQAADDAKPRNKRGRKPKKPSA